MKHHASSAGPLARLTLAGALALAGSLAFAHGDEPHGDEPHAPAGSAGGLPRFEAASDAFEVVGRLESDVFTLYLNRFKTNEPVAKAEIELESGDLKATATYDPVQDSYRVAEAGFVKALSQPGNHALVVTLTAGSEADLLEGSLEVAAPLADAHGGAWAFSWRAVGAVLGAALLVGIAFGWRRARRHGDSA